MTTGRIATLLHAVDGVGNLARFGPSAIGEIQTNKNMSMMCTVCTTRRELYSLNFEFYAASDALSIISSTVFCILLHLSILYLVQDIFPPITGGCSEGLGVL